MEQAAGQDTSAEADQLREDLTSPTSARITGVHLHAKDPHAGEHRIAATLDKINLLAARKKEVREYLDWFLPVWAILSEDDRFVLENFFLGEGSQDERVAMIGDHFYIQRDSVYRRKNRALDRLVTALYGRR
ncbi:hypothetical protein CHUV2995_02165 [Corynebacterium diphtheriae subsp. lausannense]|uniref:hypothetical protein n=1 Tax=Corynebacterium belfantii TaxID=2014537 RepID=UPI000DC1CED6|nr:hypothetical protein [Corynebacterium belfantii]SPJ41351.1 hypothetical protein CHUV2995_02165 [Corynebacterium diphtheriae subsp. lausannense]